MMPYIYIDLYTADECTLQDATWGICASSAQFSSSPLRSTSSGTNGSPRSHYHPSPGALHPPGPAPCCRSRGAIRPPRPVPGWCSPGTQTSGRSCQRGHGPLQTSHRGWSLPAMSGRLTCVPGNASSINFANYVTQLLSGQLNADTV